MAQDRPFLEPSSLPNDAIIPERDTPQAVIHLLRLARANPSLDGNRIGPSLTDLASMLNARLPAELQIQPSDPRLAEPIVGDARAIGEYAVASIGKYVTNPAIQPTLDARMKGFIILSRYFVWCRGLWRFVELRRPEVDAFKFDYETMAPAEDVGEQALGLILHWLASLSVVIEGWEELELSESAIDAHLATGGGVKVVGSTRYRLQRFRNGVFHYQQQGTEDARFTDFWNGDVVQWAIKLEGLFDHFFRYTWLAQQTNVEPWLYRGLEARYDPSLPPPESGPSVTETEQPR